MLKIYYVRSALLFSLLSPLFAGGANAQGLDLYVGGFASQGFVISSANSYLVKNSVEGSFEYNEAALTVQATPTDRLRIGIQMMARDLGDIGNNQVLIDWAGLDYRWQDYLGLRVGKNKMPLGLYNQGRDIDFLRTSVLLPQSVYSERQRDFVLAHEGLSVYGSIGDMTAGYLDYEGYCGTLTVPDPTVGFWGDIFEQSGREAKQGLQEHYAERYGVDTARVDVTFLGTNDRQVTFPIIYGGALIWNSPLYGLRFGTSWAFSEFDMFGRWGYAINTTDSAGEAHSDAVGFEQTFEFEIDQLYTLSMEYTCGSVGFAAEYNSNTLDQNGHDENREEGYYARISYRLCPMLTVGCFYSEYFTDADDHSGSSYKDTGYPDFAAWEKDLALSLRVDLSENWILKGEYHYLDGVALQSTPDLLDRAASSKLHRYWSSFLLKTTVHF